MRHRMALPVHALALIIFFGVCPGSFGQTASVESQLTAVNPEREIVGKYSGRFSRVNKGCGSCHARGEIRKDGDDRILEVRVDYQSQKKRCTEKTRSLSYRAKWNGAEWIFDPPGIRITGHNIAGKFLELNRSPELSLEISCEQLTARNGTNLQIRATITNQSDKPVTLVRPADGSETGQRTPIVGWSVIPAKDAKQPHPVYPDLPDIKKDHVLPPPAEADLFTIAPKTNVPLEGIIPQIKFPGPGSYRIVLLYINEPGLKWSGQTPDPKSETLLKGIGQSSPCSLTSNELIITIVE